MITKGANNGAIMEPLLCSCHILFFLFIILVICLCFKIFYAWPKTTNYYILKKP